MELDFSFALVSSLTPRNKTVKHHLGEKNCADNIYKPLKIKPSQDICKSDPTKKRTQVNNRAFRADKENQISKEQFMNRNEKHTTNKTTEANCFRKDTCISPSISNNISLDMRNISVRKKKIKNIDTNISPTQLKIHNNNGALSSSPKNFETKCNSTLVISSNEDKLKGTHHSDETQKCKSIPKSSHCLRITEEKTVSRRKSQRLSEIGNRRESSYSCDDVVESSFVDSEKLIPNIRKDGKSSNTIQQTRRTSLRISSVTDSSLSPSYDSHSIPVTCQPRLNKSVVEGTPETDISSNKNLKDKSSPKCYSTKQRSNKVNNSGILEIEMETSKSLLYDDIEKLKESFNSSNLYKGVPKNSEPSKEPKPSNKTDLTNIFKLGSSIIHQPKSCIEQKNAAFVLQKSDLSKKEKRKLSTSSELKESDKNHECKQKRKADMDDSNNTERIKFKHKTKRKNLTKTNIEKNKDRIDTKIISMNGKINSFHLPTNVKAVVTPPTEVIPKFEHIKNWLKNTQEASIMSLSSECPSGSPVTLRGIPTNPRKTKGRLSLSPRIKKKMQIASSTLHEEKKLFKDLYGSEEVKSGEAEEEVSLISSQESVEFTENVLDELYGTVWQKSVLLPQSEPKKRREKKSKKVKAPQTEKKKQRTSIYDVFSSSSSEDRFEEFLESVQRGRLKSKVRRSGRPGTPDFIKETDSDSNDSPAFYQNILSSAVKEDIKKIRSKETENKKLPVNQRKLSFSSSKDDQWSESGKSDIQNLDKDKKTLNKDSTRSHKTRSKKNVAKDSDKNCKSDKNIFTLVTPLKLKDKKCDDKSNSKINNIEPKVPKSGGKSKTPRQPAKTDDLCSSEERLRKKYLLEHNFKVPKKFTPVKTPTKPTKRDVPSSPALSFLSSLSEMTAGLPCHPDALLYKRDFKNRREELSKKLFSLYNKEIFELKLPDDMLIQWNTRMRSTSGYCYNKRTYRDNQVFRSSRIVLSTKILDRADRLRDTLIHELCHAATWILDGTSDGHGPKWKAWADKANRRFPELPVIKRCHDYAISTKYTYKCMSCGYSIGRHSKSLDIERKRCGFCYGKFQVFVTAKMATASATSGSDSVKTARTPSGFALFVKDNYAAIKKENNVPHAQVMKLLSQKFAEVKISKQNALEKVVVVD